MAVSSTSKKSQIGGSEIKEEEGARHAEYESFRCICLQDGNKNVHSAEKEENEKSGRGMEGEKKGSRGGPETKPAAVFSKSGFQSL